MKTISKFVACAALGALASGYAYAEKEKTGVPGVDADVKEQRGAPGFDMNVEVNASADMMQFDKNSDGKITKAEANDDRELKKQFKRLDANNDNELDQGEFAQFEAKGHGKMGDESHGKMGDKDHGKTGDKKGAHQDEMNSDR